MLNIDIKFGANFLGRLLLKDLNTPGTRVGPGSVTKRWPLKAEKCPNEKKKKVDENNGQLRFVRHHGWCTQARLDHR